MRDFRGDAEVGWGEDLIVRRMETPNSLSFSHLCLRATGLGIEDEWDPNRIFQKGADGSISFWEGTNGADLFPERDRERFLSAGGEREWKWGFWEGQK